MNVRSDIFLMSIERPHRAGGLALIAAAIVAFFHAKPVMSADYLIHDRYGRRISTVDRIDRDTLTVHDRYGRRVGTLTPNPSGRTAIEGRFGHKIETISPSERGTRSRPSK